MHGAFVLQHFKTPIPPNPILLLLLPLFLVCSTIRNHQHDVINRKSRSMAYKRCKSQIPVPPPSPVPTAKGFRTSANQPLTEYLENTIPDIPDLAIPPEAYIGAGAMTAPAVIDYRTLTSRKGGAVETVVKSAREFGLFQICGHGISGQELGLVMDEAQRFFEDSDDNHHQNRRIRRSESIPCIHSRNGTLEFNAPKFFNNHKHRNFWIHMGNVASRLDDIVDQVIVALSENLKERIEETQIECLIYLCRYPYDNVTELSEKNDRSLDHALRFYLPMEECIFYVQSERGPLSFDAAPRSMVVTVGKQLEEWSRGEFKCVEGEMIFMPSMESRSSQAAFSIELKCFSSKLSLNKLNPIITLCDQLLIMICILYFCKFLFCLFFSSS